MKIFLATIALAALTSCGPEWHDGRTDSNPTEAFIGSGGVVIGLACVAAAMVNNPLVCFP